MKRVEQELKQELMSESPMENLARNEMIRREDSKKYAASLWTLFTPEFTDAREPTNPLQSSYNEVLGSNYCENQMVRSMEYDDIL